MRWHPTDSRVGRLEKVFPALMNPWQGESSEWAHSIFLTSEAKTSAATVDLFIRFIMNISRKLEISQLLYDLDFTPASPFFLPSFGIGQMKSVFTPIYWQRPSDFHNRSPWASCICTQYYIQAFINNFLCSFCKRWATRDRQQKQKMQEKKHDDPKLSDDLCVWENMKGNECFQDSGHPVYILMDRSGKNLAR